jgi:hypothetical protein
LVLSENLDEDDILVLVTHAVVGCATAIFGTGKSRNRRIVLRVRRLVVAITVA